jgi:hypothetical protein
MFDLANYWVLLAVFGLASAAFINQPQPAFSVSKPAVAVAGATGFATVQGDSALQVALHREAELLKCGVARRQPAEADTTFLKRLFPASFSGATLVRYAWRPGAFGKQLFFAGRERDAFGQEGEGMRLFVLDPFQPDTYAVQALRLTPSGDITNLASFFFTDINQDGQKELLALVYAEVQQVDHQKDGSQLVGRLSQWQTQVFRYAGLDRTGRPHYQRDRLSRPYLNHLRTAAAVRQALASHARAAR